MKKKEGLVRVKVITFKDIVNMNISPVLCYEWVEEMLNRKKNCILPAKISIKPNDDSFCNIMPCMIPGENEISIGGIKVVTRYPERIPSLDSKLMLFDAKKGDFLAIMDANWITAMRTGAVAAHSIIRFAKKDFKNISILGLGNTARATLLVLASVMKDKQFNVKLLKYKQQEDLFVERFTNFDNIHFSFVDTYETLIKGADVVISCATYFDADICSDEYFDPGVLVVPVHTRAFTTCDLFFDKVYADDINHVKHFKNFEKFKYFSEVSDVLSGQNLGRENDDERILVYNIGIAIHDVNFASHIYSNINDALELDLKDPVDKFWV